MFAVYDRVIWSETCSPCLFRFPVIPPYVVFSLPTGQIRDPPAEILILVSAETMLGFSPTDVNNSANVQVRVELGAARVEGKGWYDW